MTPTEYVENVLVTETRANSKETLLGRLTLKLFKKVHKDTLVDRFTNTRTLRLVHGQMGLSSELSEIEELYRKAAFDAINLKEEMGDLYWYMGIIVDELDFNPEAVFGAQQVYRSIHMNEKQAKESFAYHIGEMNLCIGTIADLVKKHTMYGKALDKMAMFNQLCLLDAAIANSLSLYGMSPEEARVRNIEKLRARYGAKFTEAAALKRNLVKEREILEKP